MKKLPYKKGQFNSISVLVHLISGLIGGFTFGWEWSYNKNTAVEIKYEEMTYDYGYTLYICVITYSSSENNR